jgi:hypothetical protein
MAFPDAQVKSDLHIFALGMKSWERATDHKGAPSDHAIFQFLPVLPIETVKLL